MTSITGRLLNGSIWVSAARLFTNGLALLSTFILAWYLSPADFGLVAIGTTILAILTSVTEFSLSQALVRHEAPDETHLSAAWTINALRGMVLCICVCAAAWPVALFFGDQRLNAIMYALGASLLISGLANPKLAMAQRSLEYWQYFVISTGEKLFGFAAAVTIAVMYQSYWALVVGSLATQLSSVVLSYFIMPFRPRILFRYFREFMSFSGWLMGSQLVNTLNWRFDELLVGKMLGPASLGLYTMGGNLAQIPTRETTAPLMRPLFPSFNLLKHDQPRLRAAYQRVQTLVTAVALPAGVGMASLASLVISFALGPKWLPLAFIVEVLAVVFAFQTLGSIANPVGMALGETRTLFVRDCQLLALRVPLMLVGALWGGLSGVVLARVVTGGLSICMNLFLLRRFIGISIMDQLFGNLRTIIATLVMAVAVSQLVSVLPDGSTKLQQGLQVLSMAATGAIIYVGSVCVLWIMAGRPAGPEREFLAIIKMLTARFKLLLKVGGGK